jgi:FixJ family two-component response regulator
MEQAAPARRIAVLDDDASVLKALRRLLQMAGYQVSTYSNGPDLLQDMASSRPDCLLLDVHVPGMNGFEVLRRARAAHAGTTAIFITAFEELAGPARRDGVFAQLRKPFDNGALLQSIAACLAARSPGPAGARSQPQHD